MNFLEFAVWGAYLTSLGNYLGSHGLGQHIGWFYVVQGLVSLFMPGLIGMLADRWVQAQRLLGICHLLAGGFMTWAAAYALQAGDAVQMTPLFTLYTLSVAFYMPTLALSNSVAFTGLTRNGLDTIKDFPPIRIFGTIGFICTMLAVNFLGFQSYRAASAFCFAFTPSRCPRVPPTRARKRNRSLRVSASMPSACSRNAAWPSSLSSPCC